MGSYDAWNKRYHVELFDAWARVPLFVLRNRYERFNEVRMLNSAIDGRISTFSLLEVGCATGEFFRYFAARHPKASYLGCDVSESAIRRAQEKYQGAARFIVTDEKLSTLLSEKPDVVFCRDVVLHQPAPFVFLRELYALTQRLLILRIRTRDLGVTETDPEKSCQLHAAQWIPYIVLNCKELLQEVEQLCPPPNKIHLVKHYMVLGGQHGRYLPKECYLEETRTAESALLIEKGDGSSPCFKKEEAVPENLQFGLVNRILGRFFRR